MMEQSLDMTSQPHDSHSSDLMAARNLALGQNMDVEGDILIPCSACYLNLRRVEDHVKQDDGLLGKINEALRPYADFDDPQDPKSMEPVLEALGAELHEWNAGAR